MVGIQIKGHVFLGSIDPVFSDHIFLNRRIRIDGRLMVSERNKREKPQGDQGGDQDEFQEFFRLTYKV